MDRERIAALGARLAGLHHIDGPLEDEIAEALESAFPDITATEATDAGTLSSVDGVLHLVGVLLPDWTIGLEGRASEGDRHWRCTLRHETAHDDDEMIGHGSGPRLAPALLAALLGIAAIRVGR